MTDRDNDGNTVFLSDSETEEDLESSVIVLDTIARQHRQMTQACSMMVDLLDDDDDGMGNNQDGDYSVDPARGVYDFLGNMLSGHASRFFRVTGFTIHEWEVISITIGHTFVMRMN